jgi:hypothetical protein
MSQFDLSAGTNGDGACILSGKDKPAKPTTKSEIGVLIAPRIEDCVFLLEESACKCNTPG